MTDPRAHVPLHLPLPGATVGEAWSRLWKKGFTFAGRSSRSEYWWIAFTNGLLITALYILYIVVAITAQYSAAGEGFAVFILVVMMLWSLATVIPFLSLTIRRLHDANLSGGAWFVCLIPFVGSLILFIFTVLASNPLGMRFDPLPAAAAQRPHLPPPPPPPAGSTPGGPASAYSPAASLIPSSFVGADTADGFAPPPQPAPAFTPPPTLTPPPPPPTASFTPPPPPSASAPSAIVPTTTLDDDIDATRLSAPRASATWMAVLNDGRKLPLATPLIFGRNPVGGPAYEGATLVPVGDPTSSVSKTHAVVVLHNGLPAVTDLRSTNGTTVTDADGNATSLTPGVPHAVTGPARVVLGDYEVDLVPAG